MDFEAFVEQTLKPGTPPPKRKNKTAEEILAEFAPMIAADKQRGG